VSRLSRDEILDRTDLPGLADELLGPRRGRGASATWPCPSHQPQTGRTPPVSVFTSRRGDQRWHCHACGDGGTAIDLLIATCGMDVRGALDALAARAHPLPRLATTLGRARPGSAAEAAAARVSPVVRDHVGRCTELLWTERGREVRDWLHRRGFTDATLRYHEIGADPGPRHLDRPRGLPWRGPAAILPVHHADQIVYFQARYLDPDRAGGRKYDNPARDLATPCLATLEPTRMCPTRAVFVCEGLPDALSVTQAGHRAVAVLGVGHVGPLTAERLANEYPANPIRVIFDNDARGNNASEILIRELRERDHLDAKPVVLPDNTRDANDWLRADPVGFADGLDATALALTIDAAGIGLDL
jgi:DNA primase